jgi:Fic family protein
VDVNKFKESPVGNLVRIRGTDGLKREYDHFSYVPHPLGDEPELSNAAWRAVSRANRALGALDKASRQVPNPALIRMPMIRREAQSTSALEGTYAPLDRVLAVDDASDKPRSAELSEIMNYVEVADQAFDWVQAGRRITPGLMTELHRTLVRGTAADNLDAGAVRSVQVVIGSRGASIKDARFIPQPAGTELETAFRDLLEWINEAPSGGRDPIIAAALAHYQFETIHPFNDGNGRLGRLLIVLGFMRDAVVSEPLLSVSPWFEARRDIYQDQLASLSATGDWSAWVEFFAEGIAASAQETATLVDDLLDVSQKQMETLRKASATGVILDVAGSLLASPIVTKARLAKKFGKNYQTISNAVVKLQELGILDDYPYETSQNTYIASDIFNILTRR